MKLRTPQETANEQTIRKLYSLANSATKDTAGFVAMFAEGGYFYDVGAGKKYYGQDIGFRCGSAIHFHTGDAEPRTSSG